MLHDASARVPLVVYDPSPAAGPTRGTVCSALVESIDLAATFVDIAGGGVGDWPDHIQEGRSLLPFLHGAPPDDWREFVISECDYSVLPYAKALGVPQNRARIFMVTDDTWKFILPDGGFRPILFNLKDDPDELVDLGADSAHADVRARVMDRLIEWARRRSQRTTMSNDALLAFRNIGIENFEILVGVYDPDDRDGSPMAQGTDHRQENAQSFLVLSDSIVMR